MYLRTMDDDATRRLRAMEQDVARYINQLDPATGGGDDNAWSLDKVSTAQRRLRARAPT